MIINSNNNYLVIDFGISNKSFHNKIKELKIDIDNLNDFIITHEHQDHVKGLKVFLKKHTNKRFYYTNGTNKALKNLGIIPNNISIIEYNNKISINNFDIYPLETSHDANEPIGLVIKSNNKKIAVISDTGYIPNVYDDMLENLDCYLFEANHDVGMLMKSPRPHNLKVRIISETGHMSNDYVTSKLNDLIKKESIWVILHISEECNNKEMIERAIVKNFDDPFKLKEIYYTSQDVKTIKI